MLPDRVSKPGPLTYESGALPIALRGPALAMECTLYHAFHSSGQTFLWRGGGGGGGGWGECGSNLTELMKF